MKMNNQLIINQIKKNKIIIKQKINKNEQSIK